MSYYRFFRVEKPFQVFQLVGQSSTNTYYGSSRLSRGVARPVMLKVGDVIGSGGGHDLRLVQGNQAVKIGFSPPADPLERSYGPGPSFAIEQKVKSGELVAIEEPAGLTFNSPGTRFPDNHPGVTEARTDEPYVGLKFWYRSVQWEVVQSRHPVKVKTLQPLPGEAANRTMTISWPNFGEYIRKGIFVVCRQQGSSETRESLAQKLVAGLLGEA